MRRLGLNWRQEYQRACHLILWYSAYLLPYTEGYTEGEPTAAPLVPRHVDDLEVIQLGQERFVAGRKRLRQLPITVVRIEGALSKFRDVVYPRLPPTQQAQFDRLELRARFASPSRSPFP